MRRSFQLLAGAVVTAATTVSTTTRAADEPAIDLESDTRPSAALSPAAAETAGPPVEAPPPPPYKKSLVLDAGLGALTFLGKFGTVAPTAPWLRAQLGYELFKWLMVLGEGELGFATTSGSQPPPRTRAFPMYGFGGGVRFTARFTDRFAAYFQGTIGVMQAEIRTNALAILGYRDAEDLGLYAAGRLGVEWYQIDRHYALGLSAGLRDATGFQRQGAGTDTPLAIDGAVSLRYAF